MPGVDNVPAVFVPDDSTELRFSTERDGLERIAGDETHGFTWRAST
jgi:hypothetical protein